MATHAESKNQGTIIVDSTLNIENINNSDQGLSVGQVMTILPKSHDLSSQCDGSLKDFVLSPAVVQNTLNFFSLYLDGVLLTRSADLTISDYVVSSHSQINLHQSIPAPPAGSSLIAIYIGVVG
jgi:hypothetical protein